jgi:glycosyltransferase involved in cell wall biosynthesis
MTVTIGLPVYNCEATVLKTLRSIFAQTYSDWELVIVDDGSTDRSAEILRAVRDPRVTVLSDGKNLGLVPRLNQIIAYSGRPFICRMDADDLMHPERVERQMAFFAENPSVDVVGTMAISIDDDDRPYRLRSGNTAGLRDPVSVLQRGGLIHASIIAKREWCAANPYSDDYPRAEDFELWLRTCQTSHLAQLDKPLYYNREVGQVSLAKYRRSSRMVRKVSRSYGPGLVGRVRTAKLLARSHAKETLYRLFALAGQASRIAERRGKPLPKEEEVRARQAIDLVLQTPVPGIDG